MDKLLSTQIAAPKSRSPSTLNKAYFIILQSIDDCLIYQCRVFMEPKIRRLDEMVTAACHCHVNSYTIILVSKSGRAGRSSSGLHALMGRSGKLKNRASTRDNSSQISLISES